MKKILIIAGSDPSGGAGIQADIRTATTLKTYASAIITTLTSQNTSRVVDIFTPDSYVLDSQLKTIFNDIKFDIIKIGVVGGLENAKILISNITKYCKDIPIIIDPVMVATSNDRLCDKRDIGLIKKIISRSLLVTPNISEAQELSGISIKSKEDMIQAAKKIQKTGVKNVLIKAGHLKSNSKHVENIFLDIVGDIHIIRNKRLMVGDIHGTGCALSTAISCNFSKNKNLLQSIKMANRYIYKNIKNSNKIGKGSRILTYF